MAPWRGSLLLPVLTVGSFLNACCLASSVDFYFSRTPRTIWGLSSPGFGPTPARGHEARADTFTKNSAVTGAEASKFMWVGACAPSEDSPEWTGSLTRGKGT
eukprot:1137083-Pelagomonas_calceolata.AAC.2